MSCDEKFYEALKTFLDNYGFVDYVFTGVDINDERVLQAHIGVGGRTMSNRQRCQRMVGLLTEEIHVITHQSLAEAGAFRDLKLPP